MSAQLAAQHATLAQTIHTMPFGSWAFILAVALFALVMVVKKGG